MRLPTDPEIRMYMRAILAGYIDPLTDEVNATELAEDACDEFKGYAGDDIPEHYFELAHEVASEYKAA